MAQRSLPPFVGIRVKPLDERLAARALRTLDLFLTTLVGETKGALPDGFVVTLPKVVIPEQAAALSEIFSVLERELGLPEGALKMEVMVEQTQTLVDSEGRATLPRILAAAGDRLVGAHFGTYDYTASCNVTAAHQSMAHPACDFAKQMMLVAFSGTGVAISDGATTTMPVPPHRRRKDGPPLTEGQLDENRATVHRAWRLHFDDARRSLMQGIYQGWDLHPAQLPSRYAAVYSFFLEGLDAASARLRAFVDGAAQATRLGDVFDDAATGQGLLNFFLRGVASGALTEDEAKTAGVTLDELRGRSFQRILDNRRRDS